MAIKLSEKQIKDGWQIVKFGEIAKEVKSTTKDPAGDDLEFYVGLDHLDPQSLRIARKGIIEEDNPSFTRRFSAGQILFGKRRCYQKKAAVADFEGICSGDIIVMDAIPKKIIPSLLPFIIQSDAFFDWAEKTSSGSLSPRTKWKSLSEFEFPLPPIERQNEILDVFNAFSDLLYRKVSTLESIDRLITATRVKSFHRGRWDELFKVINTLCEKELLLDKVAKRVTGHTPDKKKNSYWNGGIKWVSLKDTSKLDNVYIDKTCDEVSQKGIDNSSAVVHPKGTVILSRDAGVGKSAILAEEMAVSQHFVAWKCTESINPIYLYFWLQHMKPVFEAVAIGSTIKTIGMPFFKSLKIALPEVKEQKKIAETMLYMANAKNSLKESISNTIKMRQKISQHLFSGDSNDIQ